jgi:hypothetical protein
LRHKKQTKSGIRCYYDILSDLSSIKKLSMHYDFRNFITLADSPDIQAEPLKREIKLKEERIVTLEIEERNDDD